jgi:hypothetical protein
MRIRLPHGSSWTTRTADREAVCALAKRTSSVAAGATVCGVAGLLLGTASEGGRSVLSDPLQTTKSSSCGASNTCVSDCCVTDIVGWLPSCVVSALGSDWTGGKLCSKGSERIASGATIVWVCAADALTALLETREAPFTTVLFAFADHKLWCRKGGYAGVLNMTYALYHKISIYKIYSSRRDGEREFEQNTR